jgi:hypothetical protein
MPRLDEMAGANGCSTARLICIDPARVHEFWPYVSPLIRAAMERGGITDFGSVAAAISAGRALVWIAIAHLEGERPGMTIKAAAVTELSTVNGARFCTVVACGGRDRAEWLPLLAGLERYARAESCKAMRIFGRRGWERLLPDYKAARVLLEKELS